MAGRWLVAVSYRYTYLDAATQSCHVVGRWKTTLGHRFEHVPVELVSDDMYRGKGALLNFTKKLRRQVTTPERCCHRETGPACDPLLYPA